MLHLWRQVKCPSYTLQFKLFLDLKQYLEAVTLSPLLGLHTDNDEVVLDTTSLFYFILSYVLF